MYEMKATLAANSPLKTGALDTDGEADVVGGMEGCAEIVGARENEGWSDGPKVGCNSRKDD